MDRPPWRTMREPQYGSAENSASEQCRSIVNPTCRRILSGYSLRLTSWCDYAIVPSSPGELIRLLHQMIFMNDKLYRPALKCLAMMAIIAAPVCSALASEGSTAETDAGIAKARLAISELAASLKESLVKALDAGGPIAALPVCKSIAPEAAASASQTHGLTVRRTALRVRNPDNTPDDFERRVLEEFVSQTARGSDPEKLEHVEIVSDGSGRTLRFMKPIVMAEKPCAACHGKAIAPEVLGTVKSLYPADAATGFAPGEIRGAFSVSMPIEAAAKD